MLTDEKIQNRFVKRRAEEAQRTERAGENVKVERTRRKETEKGGGEKETGTRKITKASREGSRKRTEGTRKKGKGKVCKNGGLIFPRILILRFNEHGLKLSMCFRSAMPIPEKIYNEIRNL